MDQNNRKNQGPQPGIALLGGLLILLGVLFLAGELFDIHLGEIIWPFFIIGPGVAIFLGSLIVDKDTGKGLASVGGIVTMVGLILLGQNITGLWASWAYAWALVAPTSIGMGLFAFGLLKNLPEQRREGWDIMKVGLGIFFVAGVFFELFIGLSGFKFGTLGWPLLLIALGVFLFLRNLSGWWQKEPDDKEELHVYDKS